MEVMVTNSSTSSGRARDAAAVTVLRLGPSDTLHATLVGLTTPLASTVNPASARAELEEARKQLLAEGTALATAKRGMEAAQREYNSAYGFTPTANRPNRHGDVRGRGWVVAKILGGKLPIHDTPAANMRAAQATLDEMDALEGEERARQEKHVKDLLVVANEQRGHLVPDHAFSVSPHFNYEGYQVPSGCQPAQHSSSPHSSGRRAEGSRGRRSQHFSEHQVVSIHFCEPPGDEGGSVHEVTPPDRQEKARTPVPPVRPELAARPSSLVPGSENDARIRLDSLPADSVNTWVDFEEAFVRNFTGTYKCLDRPRELAMCVQKPDEPLCDYATRWTELRNSCKECMR
ncbi:hypothetical protein ZWY2020_008918 [Hordeum vulgare]|nr:hypothetical protein ZWY2020_008918 [Hordeum vulgare]